MEEPKETFVVQEFYIGEWEDYGDPLPSLERAKTAFEGYPLHKRRPVRLIKRVETVIETDDPRR